MKYRLKRFANRRAHAVGGTRGFTLVELMLAASIFSIVLFAAGTLLVGETRNAARNRQIVNMQRDASLAMEVVGNRIRGAYKDIGEVSQSNNKIVYFDSSLASYVEWNTIQNVLVLMPENMNLIDTQWEIVNFNVKQNPVDFTWRVILQVRVPDTATEFVLTGNFMPRNSDPDN